MIYLMAWMKHGMLINKDGNKYLLILRKSDKDFTAVLDNENKLLSGIIDNGILPKLFTNMKEKDKKF